MGSNGMSTPTDYHAFLSKHDTNGLRSYLESLPARDKGSAFELILTELYRGNGWLVQRQGGRGDAGADILLYHPKTPSSVSLIIQAKNHSLPLTFDQTRLELIKFEELSAPLHKCQNFRLVAVNGFVREADKLGRYNLLLDGWDHIEYLFNRYDPESTVEPTIELFAHNRITYSRINELWEDSRHVAVVQATGTGKSYLIAKVLADFVDKRKVVLAPSTYILDQQKSKMPWLSDSTDYLTYAKLFRMTKKEISSLDCGLIVLDEFHRCGADVWGKGVQRLLDSHPDAKVLGTTATPIRYLDNSRDMAEELFDGIVAENLSLAEAIVRRILPPPTYISALYTLNEECASLLVDIEASKRSEEEKTELKREVNSIKLDWEKTSGVPEILKKHLPVDINKLIVFCKDQQHLDEMEIEVQRWFLKAGTYQRRKTYRILSADHDSNRNLEDFKNACGKDTVHLLFAIDMLNEGLHIPEVGAVILLRPTESPIIFYQQIGRCIQVGKDQTPIIFDLVNNFQNVRANDFLGDIEEAKSAEACHRADLGLPVYVTSVKIEELAKPIEDIFESIRERLDNWEAMFSALCEYKSVQGNCNVPHLYKDNISLGIWTANIRKRKNILTFERINKLDQLGFEWEPIDILWDKMFKELIEYKEINGHCNVPRSYGENTTLSSWVYKQRRTKMENKLPQNRNNKLESIGFNWNPFDTAWDEMYLCLKDYNDKYGNCNVPRNYETNLKLSKWVSKQRVLKNHGTLSISKTQQLEGIGFDWQPYETYWETMFVCLKKFKEIYGHCNVPKNYLDDSKLAIWVGTQRTLKKKLRLSNDKINRLNSIKFVFDPHESFWEEMFISLCEFKNIYGHCNVPRESNEHKQLGKWVSNLRTRKRKQLLPSAKIDSLNEIGFNWGGTNHNDTYSNKR